MKRKLLSVCLIMLMSVYLFGCGNSTSQEAVKIYKATDEVKNSEFDDLLVQVGDTVYNLGERIYVQDLINNGFILEQDIEYVEPLIYIGSQVPNYLSAYYPEIDIKSEMLVNLDTSIKGPQKNTEGYLMAWALGEQINFLTSSWYSEGDYISIGCEDVFIFKGIHVGMVLDEIRIILGEPTKKEAVEDGYLRYRYKLRVGYSYDSRYKTTGDRYDYVNFYFDGNDVLKQILIEYNSGCLRMEGHIPPDGVTYTKYDAIEYMRPE